MITRIELEQAAGLMMEGLSPLGAEPCQLNQALERTLSMDVTAPMDQPPFDRSPLDGYALRSADSVEADPEHPIVLNVVDTVYAGDVAEVPVGLGQAVRIMTGAMLPEGCDCVLRQEDTDMGFPNLSIRRNLRPNENFVHRGTDYHAGTIRKVIRRQAVTEESLIAQFPEADLILLEGFKASAWPKLELVRSGNSDCPVCGRDTLLALVTDLPIDLPGVPRIAFGDAERAAAVILQYRNSEKTAMCDRGVMLTRGPWRPNLDGRNML